MSHVVVCFNNTTFFCLFNKRNFMVLWYRLCRLYQAYFTKSCLCKYFFINFILKWLGLIYRYYIIYLYMWPFCISRYPENISSWLVIIYYCMNALITIIRLDAFKSETSLSVIICYAQKVLFFSKWKFHKYKLCTFASELLENVSSTMVHGLQLHNSVCELKPLYSSSLYLFVFSFISCICS